MNLKEKIRRNNVRAADCAELVDKTIFINRVSKVVKGGRRFSFSALVVTGDGEGHVGYGTGKANEVPDAIRKASEAARKSLIKVPLNGGTIPHDILAQYGPATVVMKPAAPGTGVIAGSVVRSVAESAGIKDIRTKCIGANSPNNLLQAAFDGLLSLKNPDEIARMRNKSLEDISYSPY
ncbi:UNVERIFIED_CONTAM: hypothetical protein GTU68_056330 [Idotea baltica]|nr:hypothetical protein [Idotea baltica]